MLTRLRRFAEAFFLACAFISAISFANSLSPLWAQSQSQPADIDPKLLAMANAGDADAQFLLGGLYLNAEGVAQNYTEGAIWIRKAAEQNHAKAQFILGTLYSFGNGVPQNYEQAVIWFRKSADQGLRWRNAASPRLISTGGVCSKTMRRRWCGHAKPLNKGLPMGNITWGCFTGMVKGCPKAMWRHIFGLTLPLQLQWGKTKRGMPNLATLQLRS